MTSLRTRRMSTLVKAVAALAIGLGSASAADVQFVCLSDVHFGFVRNSAVSIDGVGAKDSVTNNRAMVNSVNRLSGVTIPSDGGVGAGAAVGPVDFVAITGDLANRYQDLGDPQNGIQNSSLSYADLTSIVLNSVTLRDKNGAPAKFLLSPGNHDVSNAIGNVKIPISTTTGGSTGYAGSGIKLLLTASDTSHIDGTSMLNLSKVAKTVPASGVYGRTEHEAVNASGASKFKPNYSMDVGGIHLISVTIWPDAGNRNWIDADLLSVPLTTPVILFMHDYPDVDVKHLQSRVSGTPIVANFEAVISEQADVADYPVGQDPTSAAATAPTRAVGNERRFVAWLKTHPNIVAYFHGHSNSNEMYTYKGPDSDIALKCFRIDSPMKGDITASAPGKEALCSYLLASVDTTAKRMTVREVRWNPTGVFTTGVTVPVFSTDTTTAANARFPAEANVPKLDMDLMVSAPTFSVVGGTYNKAQAVFINSASSNVDIRFTTDGTAPTLSSQLYNSVAIPVNSSTTLRAIAVPKTFSSLAPAASAATYEITAADGSPLVSPTPAAPKSNTASSASGSCGSGSGLAVLFSLVGGLWLFGRRQK